MTACIFGASGLVGGQLMFICLHDDRISEVKVFVRKPLAFKHEKLKQVITDFSKPDTWAEEIKGGLVFCSVGTTIGNAGSKEKFRAVDRDIPVTIALEAERHGARHFVYVSSVGADPASSNFYLRTKGETEKMVREKYHGPLTILRPSMLLGKRLEFRMGELIGKYLMIGIDAITFGLLGRFRPIKATDVGRAMIASALADDKSTVLEGRALHQKAASY
jgi:uncharacterized protein YbjT (DUF2867 family)